MSWPSPPPNHGTVEEPLRANRIARYRDIVNRFEMAARANLEGHIKDICRVAGPNHRTLSRAFNATYDSAPRHHLRAVRLAQVREALLSANASNPSVTETALRFGFRELGSSRSRTGPPSERVHPEALRRTLAGANDARPSAGPARPRPRR